MPKIAAVDTVQLIERQIGEMSTADLQGNIWIADFIFTRCAGPCPMMSHYMSMLQPAFAYSDSIKLVSISIDPEYDTPDILNTYAESYSADPEKWYFLTGDKQKILEFARNSMKVAVEEATESSPIVHSTYFILIDIDGNIRGYYNSKDADFLNEIVVDVERLRQEAIRGARES